MLGIFRRCGDDMLCCQSREMLSTAATSGITAFGLDGEYAACFSEPMGVAAPSMVTAMTRDHSLVAGYGAGRHCSPRKGLQVPSSFEDFQMNTVVNNHTAKKSVLVMEKQRSALQAILSRFTKDLLRGVLLEVVLDDGSHVECQCCLDTHISHLTIRAGEAVRTVSFAQVEHVCNAEEVQELRTGHEFYIDDLCATLVLRESQFVTFRFDTVLMREYFTMCLGILRMAKHGR